MGRAARDVPRGERSSVKRFHRFSGRDMAVRNRRTPRPPSRRGSASTTTSCSTCVSATSRSPIGQFLQRPRQVWNELARPGRLAQTTGAVHQSGSRPTACARRGAPPLPRAPAPAATRTQMMLEAEGGIEECSRRSCATSSGTACSTRGGGCTSAPGRRRFGNTHKPSRSPEPGERSRFDPAPGGATSAGAPDGTSRRADRLADARSAWRRRSTASYLLCKLRYGGR